MDVVYHVKQLMLEIGTLEAQLRDKKAEMQKLIPALTAQEKLLMDLPAVPKDEPPTPDMEGPKAKAAKKPT
jgi:hypothetical protein